MLSNRLIIILLLGAKLVLSQNNLCAVSHGSTGGEHIDAVYLEEIANTDGLSSGYADYTSTYTANLRQGETYTIRVICSVGWSDSGIGIWINWNQDDDFDDVNEVITTTTGNPNYYITFTVPVGASLGNTKMRINYLYTPNDPCICDCNSDNGGEFWTGEAEDYLINVQSPITNGPGGVNTNLEQWLAGDGDVYTDYAGTSISDGGSVQRWSDKVGGIHAEQETSNLKPTFQDDASNNINFQPVIFFEEHASDYTEDDYLDFQNSAVGDYEVFMVVSTNDETTNTNFYENICLYGCDQNGGGDGDFSLNLGANDKLFAGGGYSGDYGEDANSGSPATTINEMPVLITGARVVNGVSDVDFYARVNGLAQGYMDPYNFTTSNCGQNISTILSMGKHPTAIGDANATADGFDGGIAEFAVYNSKNSTGNRNSIESYLAIKYGIHLDQTTAQDYVLSDGSIVWDASVVGASYSYDITAIGRDDESDLYQRQSKSENQSNTATGDDITLLTIGIGDIKSSNSQNSTSFSSDLISLSWSNDNGTFSSWSTTNIPSELTARITRQWIVEENNGDVGEVQIQINENDLPATADVVHLILDSDDDFTSGTTLLFMTLSGGVWSRKVNLTDGQRIGFGINSTVLSVSLIDFSLDCEPIKKIKWTTGSEENNSHFRIEGSYTGQEFELMTIIPGAMNSSEILAYSEGLPNWDYSYFRIGSVDTDSNVEYSKTIFNTCNESNLSEIKITGNQLQLVGAGPCQVYIYDLRGRLVLTKKTIDSFLDLNLSTGLYQLSILSETEMIHLKHWQEN